MPIFLQTKRLQLRRVTDEDIDLLYALDGDPEVIRYTNLGGRSPLADWQNTILPHWLALYETYENRGYWIAEEKATGDFLGWFHFRPAKDAPEDTELGYRLQQSAWGQGYATEIARELVRRGFEEWGVARIIATALSANRASIRVMEKAGLHFEKNFVYEFTDPETGRTTQHPAVQYTRGRLSE
jgi:RimJ/RimL family protein N-acetyltransferase